MHNIVRYSKFIETLGDAYPMEILRPQVLSDESSYLYRESENAWRLFNFIENTTSLNFIETEEQAHEIGKAFGVFLASINQADHDQYQEIGRASYREGNKDS